jgi:hypothetical protein
MYQPIGTRFDVSNPAEAAKSLAPGFFIKRPPLSRENEPSPEPSPLPREND